MKPSFIIENFKDKGSKTAMMPPSFVFIQNEKNYHDKRQTE